MKLDGFFAPWFVSSVESICDPCWRCEVQYVLLGSLGFEKMRLNLCQRSVRCRVAVMNE